MNETSRHDAWNAGDSYDAYMGRWSRQILAHTDTGILIVGLGPRVRFVPEAELNQGNLNVSYWES